MSDEQPLPFVTWRFKDAVFLAARIMSHATACTEHQLTPSAIIVTEHMVQFERRAFYTEWAELTGTFPLVDTLNMC